MKQDTGSGYSVLKDKEQGCGETYLGSVSFQVCSVNFHYQMGTSNICCLQLTEMKKNRKYRFCWRSERHWKSWYSLLRRYKKKKREYVCRLQRERSRGDAGQVQKQHPMWCSDRWGHCWLRLNVLGSEDLLTFEKLPGVTLSHLFPPLYLLNPPFLNYYL